MLTERTKLLILIIGAMAVISVVVLLVLGVFPGREAEPTPTGVDEFELPLLDEPNIGVEDAIFDSENPGPLASSAEKEESALFIAARDLAEFFVERFGTYRNENAHAIVDDLAGFMTPAMREWAVTRQEQLPEREGDFFILTEALGSEEVSFSPALRRAEFRVATRRTENAGTGGESYEQFVRVTLEQDAGGEWLVAGLYWEERG